MIRSRQRKEINFQQAIINRDCKTKFKIICYQKRVSTIKNKKIAFISNEITLLLKDNMFGYPANMLEPKGILNYLSYLGIKVDDEKNKVRSEEQCITTDDSTIPVWVVPTNEELVIAKQTLEVINK